jgi:hypothetical protein
MFSSFNLAYALIAGVIGIFLAIAVSPSDEKAVRISNDQLGRLRQGENEWTLPKVMPESAGKPQLNCK